MTRDVVRFAAPDMLRERPQLIEEICLEIASGSNLTKIGRNPAMPSSRVISSWLMAGRSGAVAPSDPRAVFWRCYQMAVQCRNEIWMGDALEIAHDDSRDVLVEVDGDGNIKSRKPNMAAVNRDKLRVSTLLHCITMTSEDYGVGKRRDKPVESTSNDAPETLEALRAKVEKESKALRDKGILTFVDATAIMDVQPTTKKRRAKAARTVMRKRGRKADVKTETQGESNE